MIKSIERSGKTEEEAIASALLELGLDRDEVSVEIIERSKSGFLGLGASPAIVKVSYEVPDAPAPAPAPPQAAPETSIAPESVLPQNLRDCAERVREFLNGLLSHMGVQAEIAISEREGGGLKADLRGKTLGMVIGRRGETLDAIQHLTNYAVNRGVSNRIHISIDAENYRNKREESLVRLAEKMAGKVIKYRRSMALEPMNSYERHVIHTALQEYNGVNTNSTGTEPNRRVVINYTGRPPSQTKAREWK